MNTLQKKKIKLQKKSQFAYWLKSQTSIKETMKTYVLRNLTEVNATDRTAYIK